MHIRLHYSAPHLRSVGSASVPVSAPSRLLAGSKSDSQGQLSECCNHPLSCRKHSGTSTSWQLLKAHLRSWWCLLRTCCSFCQAGCFF